MSHGGENNMHAKIENFVKTLVIINQILKSSKFLDIQEYKFMRHFLDQRYFKGEDQRQ
jgi:hypothetical protein